MKLPSIPYNEYGILEKRKPTAGRGTLFSARNKQCRHELSTVG